VCVCVPVSYNTPGLLLDKGIEEDLLLRHLQVADAARATLGIDVSECVVTSRPVGVEVDVSAYSGASWGSISDTETLLEGARALISKGCTAIAVVARFPEDDDDNDDNNDNEEDDRKDTENNANRDGDSDSDSGITSRDRSKPTAADLFAAYRAGQGVDAIAGAEALISHVITKELGVPCAHAPAFAEMAVGKT
jgi:Protein of unknown function (DUF3326)